MNERIHILGAAGSGTTTLGANLSRALGLEHLDADEFLWKKTPVPFSEKYPVETRVKMVQERIDGLNGWVFSGSICRWGDLLIPLFTRVIFTWIPWEIRRKRILCREERLYGPDALAPGGMLHEHHKKFMKWAGEYDAGGHEMRSRRSHESWLAALPKSVHVIRFESALPEKVLLDRALSAIQSEARAREA